METRSASLFSGAHSDEVDYVAWNPTHPELLCSSSQKDRRIVFWDARRMSHFSLSSSDSLPSEQKAGTFNSSHSRSPQSRSTMLRTANRYFMYRPGTSSSSCLTGRTPTTPRPKLNGLPWIVLPSVLSSLVFFCP